MAGFAAPPSYQPVQPKPNMGNGGTNLGGQYLDPTTGLYSSQEGHTAMDYGANQAPYAAGANSAPAATKANQSAAAASAETGAGYAVDPHGYVSYNNQDAQGRQTMQMGAGLQADAENRRLGYLSQIGGMWNSSSTGGPGGPHVSGSDPNADAARAAAFARSKDTTGQTLRAAMDSLRSQYAGTGNVGGYSQGVNRSMMAGADKMGDQTREQLMSDLNRSNSVSDRNYAGEITQRGQDMQQRTTLQSLLPSLLGLISSRAVY